MPAEIRDLNDKTLNNGEINIASLSDKMSDKKTARGETIVTQYPILFYM